MSNKLKKKIMCCICNKEVPFTEDCQKLYDEDVCPECAVNVAKMVNRAIDKIIDEVKESKRE